MRTMNLSVRVVLASIMAAGLAVQAAAEAPAAPAGVSPGAVDRYSTIRDECPTFSWEAVEGTAFYELAAYEIAEQQLSVDSTIELSESQEVLYTRVPGRAVAWTPEFGRCLAPGGRHVWFVRAVFEEADGVVLDAGEWSEGLFFTVAAAPSIEEVERALQVLHRYVKEGGSSGVALEPRLMEAEQSSTGLRQHGSGMLKSLERSVLSAPAAIRGSMPDPAGEFYGVVGISGSPQGAGVAVANTTGGADLVLDGSTQGVVDTELSESGVDRRSSTAQSFNFINSGSGVMRLKENGVRVVTVNTDQDTLGDLQCNSDEVAKWSGSAWLCADDENDGLTLPFEDSDPTAGATFKVNNTSTSGNVFAFRGDNASNAGAGVFGWSTAGAGVTSGVVGQSSSGVGTGVFGVADHTSGANYGVGGVSSSTIGTGVAGYATATSGDTTGVLGQADGTSGANRGVAGVSYSPQGTGATLTNVAGGADLVLDGSAHGVVDAEFTESGIDRSSSVQQSFDITNSGAGHMELRVDGVEVVTTATDQDTLGGLSCAYDEVAKRAGSSWVCAVDSFELPFEGTSNSYHSVFKVENTNPSSGRGLDGLGRVGVLGKSTQSAQGVAGVTDNAWFFPLAAGVAGYASDGIGVFGNSKNGDGGRFKSTDGNAGFFEGRVQVEAEGADAVRVTNTGSGRGVRVTTDGDTGVWVQTNGASAYAALDAGRSSDSHLAAKFRGRVEVSGTLSKGGGSFKIDHPLDPANRYLYHSFVESPDMMNIYNGNVVTDERGFATVVLPDWFEALNRDFRYQLTVIGEFAQAIVAQKIEEGRFVIRTDKPKVEVSWQVTGIRHDAFAEANRIPVEEDKPDDEAGFYLHPEAHSQPRELGISWRRFQHLRLPDPAD